MKIVNHNNVNYNNVHWTCEMYRISLDAVENKESDSTYVLKELTDMTRDCVVCTNV